MASPMPRLPPVTSTDLPTATPLASGVFADARNTRDAIGYPTVRRNRHLPPGLLVVLQPETDLHRHLVVRDLVVHDVPADLRDLEPVEMAKRLRGTGDPVRDGRVHSVRRRTDDLGHSVGAIRHDSPLVRLVPHPGIQIPLRGVRWRHGTPRAGCCAHYGRTYLAQRRSAPSPGPLSAVDAGPYGVLRRRRRDRRLAALDLPGRGAVPALHRGRHGQRREPSTTAASPDLLARGPRCTSAGSVPEYGWIRTFGTVLTCANRVISPTSRSTLAHQPDSCHDGSTLRLPRRSARCQTAPPVAVRHHLFSGVFA